MSELRVKLPDGKKEEKKQPKTEDETAKLRKKLEQLQAENRQLKGQLRTSIYESASVKLSEIQMLNSGAESKGTTVLERTHPDEFLAFIRRIDPKAILPTHRKMLESMIWHTGNKTNKWTKYVETILYLDFAYRNEQSGSQG